MGTRSRTVIRICLASIYSIRQSRFFRWWNSPSHPAKPAKKVTVTFFSSAWKPARSVVCYLYEHSSENRKKLLQILWSWHGFSSPPENLKFCRHSLFAWRYGGDKVSRQNTTLFTITPNSYHWIKNVLVFIALFFNANLLDPSVINTAILSFICFSV